MIELLLLSCWLKVLLFYSSPFIPRSAVLKARKIISMAFLLVRLRSLGFKEVTVIAGSFKGHVWESIKDYKDLHRGYGFGFRNKQWESVM